MTTLPPSQKNVCLERETAGNSHVFELLDLHVLKIVHQMLGAGNRVRTGDLDLGKVALYQLSYSRISSKALILGRRLKLSS